MSGPHLDLSGICLKHVLNVSETCLDCALIVGRTGMYPLHVGKFGFGEKCLPRTNLRTKLRHLEHKIIHTVKLNNNFLFFYES